MRIYVLKNINAPEQTTIFFNVVKVTPYCNSNFKNIKKMHGMNNFTSGIGLYNIYLSSNPVHFVRKYLQGDLKMNKQCVVEFNNGLKHKVYNWPTNGKAILKFEKKHNVQMISVDLV